MSNKNDRNIPLIMTLLAVLQAPAVIADPLPTFHLTLDADRDRLSLSLEHGPLPADGLNFRVTADAAGIAAQIAAAAEPTIFQRNEDFYLERRGFSDPHLMVQLNFLRAETIQMRFPVEEDLAETFRHDNYLRSVNVNVYGVTQVYKCLDENTCILDREEPRGLYVFQDATTKIQSYRPILTCDGISLAAKIGDWGNYQGQVTNGDARWHLGLADLIRGRGPASPSGFDFEGFAWDEDDFVTNWVYRDFGGIKIEKQVKPHYWCHYSRTVSYPETTKRRVALGQRCPNLSSRWWVTGSSPGTDTGHSQDWFFQECREL